MECPICKKTDCFVCKIWNDDQTMDLLMAENGKEVKLFLFYIIRRLILISMLIGSISSLITLCRNVEMVIWQIDRKG